MRERESEAEPATASRQSQEENLRIVVAYSCSSSCCSFFPSCSFSHRSSWQLNALIRVLSTSLADKHADTLNWVPRQQQQRPLQAPLLARPGQARRRLPFEVANEKLLPLEFLMPIKYADAAAAAAAAAEDAVPRRGLAWPGLAWACSAWLLANPRGQLTLTLGKCAVESQLQLLRLSAACKIPK